MKLKDIGKFAIKSIVFSIIFLFCALFFVLGIYGVSARIPGSSASTENEARNSRYDKALDRQEKQIDITEAHQKRLDKLLKLEESNANRHEATIEAWEKQAGIKQ